jgi:hypothetical protein
MADDHHRRTATESFRRSSNSNIKCFTNHPTSGYRHSYSIAEESLPYGFLADTADGPSLSHTAAPTSHNNKRAMLLDAGELHVCIRSGVTFETAAEEGAGGGRLTFQPDAQIEILSLQHRQHEQQKYAWRGMADAGAGPGHRRTQYYKQLRQGRRSLLAVRVTSAWGEEPVETVLDIERALFLGGGAAGESNNDDGGGDNNIYRNNTPLTQYSRVSHNQLQFVPAGVIEVHLTQAPVAGNDVDGDLLSAMLLNETARVYNSNSTTALSDVSNIVFCLPDGGLFGDDTDWTAFTFLFEPVRVAQWRRFHLFLCSCVYSSLL